MEESLLLDKGFSFARKYRFICSMLSLTDSKCEMSDLDAVLKFSRRVFLYLSLAFTGAFS